jgi:hypothetical protein
MLMLNMLETDCFLLVLLLGSLSTPAWGSLRAVSGKGGQEAVPDQHEQIEHSRSLSVHHHAHDYPNVDPEGCSNMPILTDSLPDSDEVIQKYNKYQKGYTNHWYQQNLRPGTLETENLFTEPLQNATFVFWGLHGATFDMSLYNNETTMLQDATSSRTASSKNGTDLLRNHYNLLSPDSGDSSELSPVKYLDGDQNYVIFVSLWFDMYQHVIIDHLGYLAYLRYQLYTTMPFTQLVLADTPRGLLQAVVEELDPEFARRVHWIVCPSTAKCRQQIKTTGKSTLQLFQPTSSNKHMDLLSMARHWVSTSDKQWASTSDRIHASANMKQHQEDRTIIYYKRSQEQGHAYNGRIMDPQQEKRMLNLIHHAMERSGRTERLVVFDGSDTSFKEQLELFRSANVIIGPHGGGLANLLFTRPALSCERRPKVLEFITNPDTPSIQAGSFRNSYHTIYSTCPWVEFHQLLFVAPSDRGTTFVDMGSFNDALYSILGRNTESSHVHVQ